VIVGDEFVRLACTSVECCDDGDRDHDCDRLAIHPALSYPGDEQALSQMSTWWCGSNAVLADQELVVCPFRR
jgi:hypothetical protein